MAKAILICGKLCCGKSVYAAGLRARDGGVLLSVDELMLPLFGLYAGEKHDEYTRTIQGWLLEKSLELLEAGVDVILDWGFWTPEQRSQTKEFYQSRGYECQMHYLDVSPEVWRARAAGRNRAVAAGEVIAYPVDSGLAAKFQSLFTPPDPDEVDVWVRE